jgi:hypothetical protein
MAQEYSGLTARPAKLGGVIMADRGQWYIAENNGLSCTIRDAEDHDEDGDGMVCEQATPSDARLIAAAPQMLQVCTMLVDAAKEFGIFNGDSQDPEWYIDCIQMAIDKATGGE